MKVLLALFALLAVGVAITEAQRRSGGCSSGQCGTSQGTSVQFVQPGSLQGNAQPTRIVQSTQPRAINNQQFVSTKANCNCESGSLCCCGATCGCETNVALTKAVTADLTLVKAISDDMAKFVSVPQGQLVALTKARTEP